MNSLRVLRTAPALALISAGGLLLACASSSPNPVPAPGGAMAQGDGGSEAGEPPSGEAGTPPGSEAGTPGHPPTGDPTDAGAPPSIDAGLGIPNCAPTPIDVPADGLSLALDVDTRSLRRAHFEADARSGADGDTASMALELYEAGALLQKGWDVCVGNSPTVCFADLAIDPGIGTRSFVLSIVPRAHAALHATVEVCVLDPLER